MMKYEIYFRKINLVVVKMDLSRERLGAETVVARRLLK